ncbi:hypothetical protein Goarm_008142 [Gossypium armourianum]|uniref:Histone acetyltransferase n=1 Tax=Gossypium armourianum TaxID=34283 RepID=A0A7J9JP19_9ROSI|nr:hypothetical protein [Gossypium armourianum]
MPRPGPRPYVCERRAWHSDRHQPMRGSLIQEIFRVVNEIHSSATKKNKEWQEKLPVVVLKAEEIMYSKANSEAEYMDIKTLWDRTNDAINTIIRRDESTETGELLQPCIEAALNLGCTARRTLRSQRNCSPRSYLNPGAQKAEGTTQGNLITNSHCMASYSSFLKHTTVNMTDMGSEAQKHIAQNGNRGTDNRHKEIKNTDSTFLEWNKFSYLTPPIDKSLSSLPRSNRDAPLNPYSNERNLEGGHMNVDATLSKRKTIYGPPVDQQFCLSPKLPCSELTGRMKRVGS